MAFISDVATMVISTPTTHWGRKVLPYLRTCPLVAISVLLALAVLTLAAFQMLEASIHDSARARFMQQTSTIETAIADRLKKQELALLGGLGFIRTADAPTRSGWKTYVDQLDLEHNFPGLLGFGFARVVPPDTRDAYIAGMRAQGLPGFDIYPQTPRSHYTSISFLEPYNERNQRAFGYDMYTEPTRRAAMDAARDSGRAAISGKVTLVQEIDNNVQAGFLMYVPVYAKGQPTATLEERRQALMGYVYSPFRMDDLMAGILGESGHSIDFSVHDTTDADSPLPLQLYDSATADSRSGDGNADFDRMSTLPLYGRDWTITFHARTGYLNAAEAFGPPAFLAASVVVNAMIFLLLVRLTRARSHAEELTVKERVLREGQESINLELQRANRSLTRFTSIAAHDLTGPLRRFDSFLQVLREDYEDRLDEEGIDIMERMDRLARRMLAMVSGLLTYSKCGSVALKHKYIDPRPFFDTFAKEMQDRAPDMQVEIDCAPGVRLLADPSLVEHVVRNILSNAVNYRSERPLQVTIKVEQDEDNTFVSIADNGIGIDPQYADRVFDMFCRLHNVDRYEGTGIGLAICRLIITDHGGNIWIDKDYTGGTRVKFQLPRTLPSNIDFRQAGRIREPKCTGLCEPASVPGQQCHPSCQTAL